MRADLICCDRCQQVPPERERRVQQPLHNGCPSPSVRTAARPRHHIRQRRSSPMLSCGVHPPVRVPVPCVSPICSPAMFYVHPSVVRWQITYTVPPAPSNATAINWGNRPPGKGARPFCPCCSHPAAIFLRISARVGQKGVCSAKPSAYPDVRLRMSMRHVVACTCAAELLLRNLLRRS